MVKGIMLIARGTAMITRLELSIQATVRDVAAILFTKQFTCESIENCIIDIVHFRKYAYHVG